MSAFIEAKDFNKFFIKNVVNPTLCKEEKELSQIKVELIDCMGDDMRVVDAARVSFNGGEEITTELGTKDERLIDYLARHNHWTPFAHPMITMRETVPIFIARQRFKHVQGFIYNEISRRYVDKPPEFYVPDEWRARPDASIKQGSAGVSGVNDAAKLMYKEYTRKALDLYNAMLSEDIAPEMARMVLPQSMMTSYYVTGSLAAFARAYKQRIDPHAQKEIQDLAVQWGDILSKKFPVAWECLTKEA